MRWRRRERKARRATKNQDNKKNERERGEFEFETCRQPSLQTAQATDSHAQRRDSIRERPRGQPSNETTTSRGVQHQRTSAGPMKRRAAINTRAFTSANRDEWPETDSARRRAQRVRETSAPHGLSCSLAKQPTVRHLPRASTNTGRCQAPPFAPQPHAELQDCIMEVCNTLQSNGTNRNSLKS